MSARAVPTPHAPPEPLVDPDSERFWQSTADGTLSMCRCPSCATFMHPPIERCRNCGGPTESSAVSGRGTVYSYVIVHHTAVPGFEDELPYVIALVELEEQDGLRLPGRLIDLDEDPDVGMRVEVAMVSHPEGNFTVPCFRPVD